MRQLFIIMRKIYLGLTVLICACFASRGAVTLEQCLEGARDNYPLIKKHGLLQSVEAVELSDINQGWLPRIGIYAQGTMQNVVPSFPTTLSAMMQQMGGAVRGLGKEQYKVGVDISQTVWDGGASKAQRDVVRGRTHVSQATVDVEMYGIRQRVQGLYFAVLLLQSQIGQTQSALAVYETNLSRLQAMLRNGTAMQSDVDMVEAQLLGLKQQIATATAAASGYRQVLSTFTGLQLANEDFILPAAHIPTPINNRPELMLFQAKERLNTAGQSVVKASIMPKVGFFAQSYYGYPGIDYFKAMLNRDMTFNIVAGIKVSWNIDGLYTRKNQLNKIANANRQVNVERQTFLLNTRMQSEQQLSEIRGLEAVMSEDARIVQLRGNVRKAAESQLRNGIIDATALTTKINDETQALLMQAYHNIKYIQAVYALKDTLNQ